MVVSATTGETCRLETATGLQQGEAKRVILKKNSLGLRKGVTHPALTCSLLSVDRLTEDGFEVILRKRNSYVKCPSGEHIVL